ncbi:MAG: hypothetical protein KF773_15900 [Deltaproteobacteria bacterium]|nr:hypothetical protein [Deltaproteobacteria bacterium]MCW5805468.1 hypothetical protein [Deltaproteobacteria bacterium]
MEARVFRWSCLGLAAVVLGILLWMVNDVRVEVKRTSVTVNEHLPHVLANLKTSTDAVAKLAEDFKNLRNLAGVGAAGASRDGSLVAYADSMLDYLETQKGARIGLDKLVGSGLKDLEPIDDWLRGARKEALLLTFLVKSKKDVLERLCKNKFGSKFYIAPAAGEPMPLLDFVRKHHPDSAGL